MQHSALCALHPISYSKGPAILERVNGEADYKNTADTISSLNISEEVECKNQCIQQQEEAQKGNFSLLAAFLLFSAFLFIFPHSFPVCGYLPLQITFSASKLEILA